MFDMALCCIEDVHIDYLKYPYSKKKKYRNYCYTKFSNIDTPTENASSIGHNAWLLTFQKLVCSTRNQFCHDREIQPAEQALLSCNNPWIVVATGSFCSRAAKKNRLYE